MHYILNKIDCQTICKVEKLEVINEKVVKTPFQLIFLKFFLLLIIPHQLHHFRL